MLSLCPLDMRTARSSWTVGQSSGTNSFQHQLVGISPMHMASLLRPLSLRHRDSCSRLCLWTQQACCMQHLGGSLTQRS